MKRSFVPHATHAEAEGAIVAALREDGARAEVEVARVVADSVVHRRGPIVAAGTRTDHLCEIAEALRTAEARNREE